SFSLPTAVVSSPVNVNLFVDLAYTDSSGVNRQLVPVAAVLTLNPGGTEPPAPEILNVTLSPSTIAPGGVSIMDVELARMAPAGRAEASPTAAVAPSRAAATSARPAAAAAWRASAARRRRRSAYRQSR